MFSSIILMCMQVRASYYASRTFATVRRHERVLLRPSKSRKYTSNSLQPTTKSRTFRRMADCEHAHETAYRSAPLIPI
jgi:hypothetical protein